MVATFEPMTAEYRDNPYPTLRRMQAEDPLHWTGQNWVVTRHADVLALLLDPRSSSDRTAAFLAGLSDEERREATPFAEARRRMMLFIDAPDHTRLRGLVTQAFSARAIERMRPRIEQRVNATLDAVEARGVGEMDVVADLADPLPGAVTADMLGVPAGDQAQFKTWAREFATAIGGIGGRREAIRIGTRSVAEMDAYLREIAAARRAEPRDDLITALLHAEEDGERLSHDEVVATVMLLLFAGNETTTNLIANGLLTLLRNPDQLQRLRTDPALIRPAIEELLRYESPVHWTARVALGDIEISGQRIREGDTLTLIIGAANRDPEQFDDPDRLDIARRPNRHLAFAHGAHFCLGAPLARAQGQIAIAAVIQRYPALRLASERAEWRDLAAFRGLKALPVSGLATAA